METKFTKSTGKEHKVKLESSVLHAAWSAGVAYAESEVGVEVKTMFVGEGSKINITGKSENGKNLGKIKDKIYGNGFIGQLRIPEKVKAGDKAYFTVKLPQLGLKAESNRIPMFPRIEVANMKWDKKEAGRSDVLKLSADVKGLRDESEITANIYEYDRDGNHERVAEFRANVKNEKFDAAWEFDYHDSTLEIPTESELQKYDKERHYTNPQYFFTLKIDDVEYGKDQESGLLKFMDFLDLRLLDEKDKPYKGEDYVILLADGKKRKGTLDENGRVREKDLPPGEVTIILPKKGRIFGK